ncbi:MAG: hypothetical protein RL077_4522 [Verrucomicrobiota bacterium]|jgi:predicted dehydrogenase
MASSSSISSGKLDAGRRLYAIVGLGSRHELYQDAIQTTYAHCAELVAVCDSNQGRMDRSRQRSVRNHAVSPAGYLAADFGRLLAECRPDVVVVTTPDASHHEYIIAAMNAGCDVVTEKPLTIDADKCRRILEVSQRTGRRCRVAFNYRYSPPRTQVKEVLMSGVVGDILSVDFHWLLNTHHGADYFRRWHSRKEVSGGLLVHKSTHHFDLINWWLGVAPVAVMASGKREFYTPESARRQGLTGAHQRCLTCSEKSQCNFYLDLAAKPKLKSLYLDQEKYDDYHRDQCVFRAEVDIEDTMNALVSYDSGATLSYSLNAFNAWEGYTVAFNGTKGRLEHTLVESVYLNGVETAASSLNGDDVKIRVVPLRGAGYDLASWTAEGDHGGGDRLMLADIFLPEPPFDKYQRAADARAGVSSVMVGIGANRSLQTGARVLLADILPEWGRSARGASMLA